MYQDNPFAKPEPPRNAPGPAWAARPSGAARIGMTLLDSALLAALSTSMMNIPYLGWKLGSLFSGLIFVAYYLGCEVYLGGTLAKLLFGFQIRDVRTGARPTWNQSAQRNWWRLVTLIPLIGGLASAVASLVYAVTVLSNGGQGAHDRAAGVEVVKANTGTR